MNDDTMADTGSFTGVLRAARVSGRAVHDGSLLTTPHDEDHDHGITHDDHDDHDGRVLNGISGIS